MSKITDKVRKIIPKIAYTGRIKKVARRGLDTVSSKSQAVHAEYTPFHTRNFYTQGRGGVAEDFWSCTWDRSGGAPDLLEEFQNQNLHCSYRESSLSLFQINGLMQAK